MRQASPLAVTIIVATLMALAMAALGYPQLVLPVFAGSIGGGFSWWVGFHQGRRNGWAVCEQAHAHAMLQAVSLHMEEALAIAAEIGDDLDDDEEAARQRLQRHYQAVQQALARIGPRP